ENYVRLHSDYHNEDKLEDLLNNWSRAPKQMELLLSYLHLIKTVGDVTQNALLKKSNATIAQLKGLVEKNILLIEKRTATRLFSLPKNIDTDFELSPAQYEACDAVKKTFTDKSVCLLHGVTSSGKTQVYIKLIEEYIREGKQVLYMLPEIALTAQIIRRLQKHFGGYIAVYHSKFNANERVEIWNRVRSGDIKIILGARSSLFLPFENLGLIVCDEEHDASYKQQEPAPRYHARDTAIFYASLFNAKVLLGSATPSIESYFNAQQKKYGLVTLKERFGNVEMPVIDIVDVKLHSTKEKLVITPPLKEQIEKTLNEKMQVIVFQNRRGYSPYLLCQVCGWIPHCENCDVTLTYHKSKNKLTCHYCGSAYPVVTTCAACGNSRFHQKNFGTEKVEETLAELFPAARIARMDYDSIKGKHDHDALIKMFEDRRIDILVGTQMVVKGLDFENVQLVGILDADGILNFADFRVNERAFQLMEQVSGRAGRKNGKGEVLIQVSKTNHPVLSFVKEHSYEKLYEMEMDNRKQFFYPPFSRIIKIIFKHKETFLAEEAANLFVSGMKNSYSNYLSGPAEPLVNRIRNQYLWEVMLRLPKDSRLIKDCKNVIFQQIGLLQNNKRYRPVTILPDVDPV
ncbi:MAG: priA, partial [Chitinophagaceae bacterium]|nr:priA [Chitinophagaceae bacterium]